MPKTVKPIETEHDAQWHWDKFADFSALKATVHEPSPHLQMIGELTEGKAVEDRIWFTGLYAAFYNIPSALVMWEEWPYYKAKTADPEEIKAWLTENWSGTFTRVERRAVRTVSNMHQCIMSYLKWMQDDYPGYLRYGPQHPNVLKSEWYDYVWQDTDKKLKFMGRYIIIRLLEALHRFSGLEPYLYDIRSIGGWSPKRALGLLYPDDIPLLMSPDTKENILKVDALAYGAMERFNNEYGVTMSPYVFAAMLCEYRVAYEKMHQYPGWTIDQEPAYWYKIKPYWIFKYGQDWCYWRIEKPFYETRIKLFSQFCLGEINGWPGTRVEPREVMRKHGYNWSDLLYDYTATASHGSFASPIHQGG